LGIALLLGIAYACNIGGVGTPIGTPPNLIFMSQYSVTFPAAPAISFFDWMLISLPIVVIMIAAIWWVLVRGVNQVDDTLDIGDRNVVRRDYESMGNLTVPERRVLGIFVMTAMFWVFRKPIIVGDWSIGGWAGWFGLQGQVDDGTVAIGAALLMFALPAGGGSRERLLDWDTAVKIPWGLLLLFGGGLALAAGFKMTGLSEWVGLRLGGLAGMPTWMMIGLVALSVTFLTEVTSNTATTTILMPVLGSVCDARGISATHLMLPAAISASCAFMLPVATAPNAIVFGTGRVRMGDMVRLGVVVNLIGVFVITAILMLW
jgi:sodium-dependent dicarboxylate transporter 2/3/5